MLKIRSGRAIAPVLAATSAAAMLAACSGSKDNPYLNIADPPLTRATLHTVTLVTSNPALAATLQGQGYTALTFPSNYPGAVRVESALWDVPEEVAAAVVHLAPPGGSGPNQRLLVSAPPAERKPRELDPEVMQAFFRNVLGTEMPRWPDAALTAGAHIQVWTFRVDDVVATAKRMREAHIPVVFSPVGLTTAYLGDHRTMAIRAPDDTVIELVQTAAH